MRIYAHRGDSANFPENSLAAFRAAVETGADGIELDVRMTADGVPVVHHDRSLRRRFGRSKALDRLTFADLRAIASHELLPTLEAVLAELPGDLHLDIELKAGPVAGELQAQLEEIEPDRYALSSFDWKLLVEAKRLLPLADCWPIASTVTPALFAICRRLGSSAVSVDHAAISQKTREEIAINGLRVIAWTVNDMVEADRLAQLEVQGFCTDDPSPFTKAKPATPATPRASD